MNFNKIQCVGDDFRVKLSQNRRQALDSLINQIENGSFLIVEINPHQLYKLHQSVRHEYQRPLDIDWGGMGQGEIGAGNQEAW